MGYDKYKYTTYLVVNAKYKYVTLFVVTDMLGS